jgi:hypothetical protein
MRSDSLLPLQLLLVLLLILILPMMMMMMMILLMMLMLLLLIDGGGEDVVAAAPIARSRSWTGMDSNKVITQYYSYHRTHIRWTNPRRNKKKKGESRKKGRFGFAGVFYEDP